MLLDEVARSPFAQTPHESFHTMQEDWKMEIEAMFDDIRVKEKVRKAISSIDRFQSCPLIFSVSWCLCLNRSCVAARRNYARPCSNKRFMKNI